MKKRLFCIVLLSFSIFSLSSQVVKEIEFRDQSITDILMVLGQLTGSSIIPDETVNGNASYFFSEMELTTALRLFLNTYKMYLREEDGVFYVSRIQISYDAQSGLISMDGEDVDIDLLIKAVSRGIGKTILYDNLPRETITVHAQGLTVEKLLEVLMNRFEDQFQLKKDEDFFYIERIQLDASGKKSLLGKGENPFVQVGDEDLFNVDFQKLRYKEVLQLFLEMREIEYIFLGRNDKIIEFMDFKEKSFSRMLGLLMDLGGGDYGIIGDIYYFYDTKQTDVLQKYFSTVRVPLTYVGVSDLPSLFPAGSVSANSFKLDKKNNAIILNGSLSEISRIQKFIAQIDAPFENKGYCRFDLNYLIATEVKDILPSELSGLEPLVLENTNSFILLLSNEQEVLLTSYLAMIDVQPRGIPVRLRFLKSEDLLKNLPPSVKKENIIQTQDPTLVFFSGSEAHYKQFLNDLVVIDKPVPQIRYDLLVIQYDESKVKDWNIDFANEKVSGNPEDSAYVFNMSEAFSFNFDIVSAVGQQFALDLQMKVTEHFARVLEDTSLTGLSGQKVQFRNTNTNRYREPIYNPDTGAYEPNGIIREIKTGLILDIDGWVSGDDMITMDISVTVSKAGDEESSTSEREVNSHVRTLSGKPLVIGGLKAQRLTNSEAKFPGLGDIPVFGLLVNDKKVENTNTELAIFILPHLEYPEGEEVNVEFRMEQFYQRFLGE